MYLLFFSIGQLPTYRRRITTIPSYSDTKARALFRASLPSFYFVNLVPPFLLFSFIGSCKKRKEKNWTPTTTPSPSSLYTFSSPRHLPSPFFLLSVLRFFSLFCRSSLQKKKGWIEKHDFRLRNSKKRRGEATPMQKKGDKKMSSCSSIIAIHCILLGHLQR